jgi:hypothetical protein
MDAEANVLAYASGYGMVAAAADAGMNLPSPATTMEALEGEHTKHRRKEWG